ncbi:cellulose binding domain-containing protein [Nonomuraea helvata]|uniref:Cellulose binding domain-containing protein n=1 Tax=Nonomuraea helvata TaxID=37484 RepID=A0ABV5SCL8_9ACTN
MVGRLPGRGHSEGRHSAVNGWTVRWTLSSGQSISQLWNGTLSGNSSAVTVSNTSYNASIPASGTTTFGFLGNGAPSLTYTSPWPQHDDRLRRSRWGLRQLAAHLWDGLWLGNGDIGAYTRETAGC